MKSILKKRSKKFREIFNISLAALILLLGFAGVYIIVNRYGLESTLLLIICVPMICHMLNTNFLRHRGKYPPKGQVTIDDVVRFVAEGKTILALRAYRELHNCGTIDAEKAVQQIKKEIKDQKSEEQERQSV